VVLACSDSRVPPEMVFDQGLGDIYVVRRARLPRCAPAPSPCAPARPPGFCARPEPLCQQSWRRVRSGPCLAWAFPPRGPASRRGEPGPLRRVAGNVVNDFVLGSVANCIQVRTAARAMSALAGGGQASASGQRPPLRLLAARWPQEGPPPALVDRRPPPALLEQRPACRVPGPRRALTRARWRARAAAGRAPGGRAGPLALPDRRGRRAVLGAAPRPARAARGHRLAPGPEARARTRARAAPAELGRRRARAQGARPPAPGPRRAQPAVRCLCQARPLQPLHGRVCAAPQRSHAERGPGALCGAPRPRACRDGCHAPDPLCEPGTSAGAESAAPRPKTPRRRRADRRGHAAQPILGDGGRAGRDARPHRAARRAAARGRPAGPPVRLRAAGGRRRGRRRRRRGAARRARAAGNGLGVAGRLDARRGAALRTRVQPQREHIRGDMACPCPCATSQSRAAWRRQPCRGPCARRSRRQPRLVQPPAHVRSRGTPAPVAGLECKSTLTPPCARRAAPAAARAAWSG
jgi:hypothetical protein